MSFRGPKIGQLIGLILVAAVVAGSLTPLDRLPITTLWDKWAHLLAYAMLGFWYAALWPRRQWAVLVAGLLLGASLECLQSLTGYRSAEWLDWIADGIGLLLGIGGLFLLRRWRPLGNQLTHVAGG